MSDADALFAAVLADPAADAPRLVFADHLDEHGDAARAEYIRVQCEAERLHPNSRRRAALDDRADDLFAAHWLDWWGPVCERVGLPPPARPRSAVARFVRRVTGVVPGRPYRRHETWVALDTWSTVPLGVPFVQARFARGFVHHLDFATDGPPLAAWVRAAPVGSLGLPPLAAEAWAKLDGPALAAVRSLRAGTFGPDNLLPLARSPHLAGLEELELDTEGEGVSAAELSAVAGATFAAGLRGLELSLRDDEAAAALAGAAALSGLRRLKLELGRSYDGYDEPDREAEVTAVAVRALDRLVRSPHLAGLEGLELTGINPTAGLVAAVGRWPNLRRLTVWDGLPADAVAALPAVEDLTVFVGPDEVAAVLGWPGLGQLRHLRLAYIHGPDADSTGPFLSALADRLDPDRLETVRVLASEPPVEAIVRFDRRFGDRAWLGFAK